MDKNTEVADDEFEGIIPVSKPAMNAFVACAMFTREMFFCGRARSAVNDWQIIGFMKQVGLLVEAPATEEHVEAGIAENVGDIVIEISEDFREIMLGMEPAEEPEEEGAKSEAAE